MKKYIMVIGASTEVALQIRLHMEDDMTEIIYSISPEDAMYQFSMRRFLLIIMELECVQPESGKLFRALQKQSPSPVMIVYTNADIPDNRRNVDLITADTSLDIKGWAIRVRDYLEQFVPPGEENRSYILACGNNLLIDYSARMVSRNGEELKLSQKQFDMLYFLASHPGQVLSKSQIFNYLWDEPEVESNNSVALHISKLRKKLGDSPDDPEYIQTVRGIGYRFAK